MSARKRKHFLAAAAAVLLGLLCAAVLGAIFYGTMVYQLLPEGTDGSAPPPGGQSGAAVQQASGQLLRLSGGVLEAQRTEDVTIDGVRCSESVLQYAAESGTIEAVSASPAAYIGRLAAQGWTPQLIAGCELAQMDAVYAERGEQGMLAACDGERVYLLIGPADEQQMYALGAACVLE